MSFIRINGTVSDSIVDGPGLRYVVFVQGCDKRCPGCHNPQTWDYEAGRNASIRDIVAEAVKSGASGITISGGEPLDKMPAVYSLAKRAKEAGLDVWLYTGYVLEWKDLFNPLYDYVDVVVDGPYVESLRSLECRFRGSTNQRLIDVAMTRAVRWAIEWEG